MIFSSYEFIFLFFPIVITVYYLLSKISNIKVQHVFIVMASLFFYGFFNPSYLAIIISSIIVNYILAVLVQKSGNLSARKLFFITGIIFNVGLLGYFKYYDFFISNVNSLFQTDFTLKYILLPLGISFFTFQQFSFLISVYKRQEKVESFIDYSLFVTFFPQLVAGPIVLYSEMMPQLKDESKRFINYDNIAKGFHIFTIGLFKKIVLADTVAIFANNGFNLINNPSLVAAWTTAISYTLQIYFDFSGYSDMAIGLAKMLNIDLPLNFNSPYKSTSIKDFWSRWHITLGRSLAHFVYIPLGGNRKGKTRTYINLLMTFLVSGLWHGAAWTFIVWGALHGILSLLERVFAKPLSKIPNYIKIFGTFMFVNATWVLFRATSWEQAINIYKGMINFKDIGISQIANIANDGLINFPAIIDYAYVFGLVTTCLIIVFKCKNSVEKNKNFYPAYSNMIFITILFLISVIHMSRISPFIYFNF